MNTRLDLIQRVVNHHSLGALVFWRPDELVMSLGCLPHWGLSFAVFPGTGLPLLYVPDNEPPVSMTYKAQVKTYPLTITEPWETLFYRINQDLKTMGVSDRKYGRPGRTCRFFGFRCVPLYNRRYFIRRRRLQRKFTAILR
jgi:hypothetical protein